MLGTLAGLLLLAVPPPPRDPASAIRIPAEVVATPQVVAWPDSALRYGGDAEGGAPYSFYDPDDPRKLVGFEIDILAELARRMHTKPEFVQNAWDSLVPALGRGDIDLALNGIEVTPDRAVVVEFTRPYYVFQQELTVKKTDDTIRGLADLKGKKVGTLSGSLARDMLEATPGVTIVTYPDVIEPYKDIELGRVDAVLLDVPVATYYGRFGGKLKAAGEPIGRGLYAGVLRKGDLRRRDAIDAALGSMIDDGTLKRILEKWGLWNDAQADLVKGRALVEEFSKQSAWTLFMAQSSSGTAAAASTPASIPDEASPERTVRKPTGYGRYFPLLLDGAKVTLLLSVLSFLVAIFGGLSLALARIYGSLPVRFLATSYVEIVRGTPLLLQLLVLYFGLPELGIAMPAFAAGIVGLGMNYAAYESEVYRAAILAIPRGQSEAAFSLGMGRVQALRWVILPQAIRIALPPSTNDFIALFKDSSLVSVITVVELTKTFQIHAASTYSYGELGAMTAALYLTMSLPLAFIARRLEERLRTKGAGA